MEIDELFDLAVFVPNVRFLCALLLLVGVNFGRLVAPLLVPAFTRAVRSVAPSAECLYICVCVCVFMLKARIW